MSMVRAAASILIALSLAGCAGGSSLGGSVAPAPEGGIAGRWMLAAPNAQSWRWALEQDALAIKDEDNQPLATLNSAGGRFEGQSTAGTPVTLSRQTTPAN
jgi:hypothetical protein